MRKNYKTPETVLLDVAADRLICTSVEFETESFVESEEVFTW